jgi:putative hydrolase of the HAD superfamily
VTLHAVLFDAGETLLHPYPSFAELLSSTLAAEGHRVSPEQIRANGHVVSERFLRAARDGERWSTSEATSRAFWGSVYGVMLEAFGLQLDDRLAARVYATFTDPESYRLFPDVLPTLGLLRRRGLGLGLVSNFEAWLVRLLDHLGLADRLEVAVISGVEGVEKPDPAIFRLALERIRLPAEAVAYVGDNPYFDVEPANAVGMRAILLDRRDRHPDHTGIRITSLRELPGVMGLDP